MTDQVEGTIFKEDVKPVEGNPDQGKKAPADQQPDLNQVFSEHLSQIKNEEGEQKYKDVFTALSALKHTQEHVKTLEEENNRYRQETVKAKTMDEVLQQIEATKGTKQEPTSSTELDVDQLRNVTFDTIRQYEAQKAAAANKQAVSDALIEKFKDGEKAVQAFNDKASELGLTSEMLEELSATSPKAVLEYFQTSMKGTSKITEGSVNTEALANASKPSEAKKNIMYGASTNDILSAWRSAGQSVQSEYSN